MKARRTHQTNGNIAFPGDPTRDLPARFDTVEGHRVMYSVWALTRAERAAIATGKANLELGVWGNVHPPVSLGLTRERTLPINPEEPPIAPDAVTLWTELERDLVIDLIELLTRLDGGACLRAGSRDRLERLRNLLLEYLPHLTPIAGEDAPDA